MKNFINQQPIPDAMDNSIHNGFDHIDIQLKKQSAITRIQKIQKAASSITSIIFLSRFIQEEDCLNRLLS